MFKFIAHINSTTELERQVDEFRRGLETPVQTAEPDFGELLKEATKQRAAAFRRNRNVSAQDESFAEKLKQATKERAAKSPDHQKNSKERANKDRARYLKPQQRKPTKGE